jgi:hypothetical protein
MQSRHAQRQVAELISPNRLINLLGGTTTKAIRRDHLSVKDIKDSGLNNRKG